MIVLGFLVLVCSWPDAAQPVPAQAAPGVTVRVEERRYAVDGHSGDEVWRGLKRAARRHGDRIVVAWTDTSVEDRIWMAKGPDGRCRVVDAAVRVEIASTVPAWSPPADAPLDLRQRWQRYAAAIDRHERGHVRRAGDTGRRLREALLGLVAPDCPTLESWSRWVGDRVIARGEAAQRRYDAETGHGATQGVLWRR